MRAYWTLPTEGRVRYRHARDYVDRFSELFRDAVADRVGTSDVGVWASGGLDSTSILATADRLPVPVPGIIAPLPSPPGPEGTRQEAS